MSIVDDTIEIPVWVKRGGMLIRREYLDADDPDQTYNYIKSLGKIPENYGVYSPDVIESREFSDWSKERLVAEILSLRKQVIAYEAAGF